MENGLIVWSHYAFCLAAEPFTLAHAPIMMPSEGMGFGQEAFAEPVLCEEESWVPEKCDCSK